MNPQEKLRLEHIAPYLPYGLKFLKVLKGSFANDPNTESIEVLTAKNIQNHLALKRYMVVSCKPVLRPLSDITKDDNIDLYESLSYNSKMFVLRTDLKQHDWVKAIRYDDFTNLLKNHFDMFNLIEKGLAIDFNQLKLTDN